MSHYAFAVARKPRRNSARDDLVGNEEGGRRAPQPAGAPDIGRPQRQPGTFTARYTCNLPPARIALDGHGLLGGRGEVNGSLTRRMSADFNIAAVVRLSGRAARSA